MLFGKKKGRVPVSKIPKDWDAGYKAGYPLWEKGEVERKAGNYQKAIDLYDEARNHDHQLSWWFALRL